MTFDNSKEFMELTWQLICRGERFFAPTNWVKDDKKGGAR
jgi:hypothetical protein